MENKYFKEIMDALKEISVEQAVLKSQVETHLKQTTKLESSVKELEDDLGTVNKTIGKQDIFMKASIWFYSIVFTTIGYKIFHTS